MAYDFGGRPSIKAVPRSPEFDRIAALPRRVPDGAPLVDRMTRALKLPGGEQTLLPDQALALSEIAVAGGAIVLLSPGSGKTLVGALAATVLDAERPMYLCPSNARRDLEKHLAQIIRLHWRVHPGMQVFGFGELQTKRGQKLLEIRKPDLIVIDEVHFLRNKKSARGSRIVEFVASHPGTRLVIMTGSPSNRDLLECAHLFAMALGAHSPVPRDKDDVRNWSDALGSEVDGRDRPLPGILERFIELVPSDKREAPTRLDLVRRGFRERLRLTPGVITTTPAARTRKLVLRTPELSVPSAVVERFRELRETAALGDNEYAEAAEVSLAAKQLICGFYYRWVWPNNVKNQRWIDARRDYNREVRAVVMTEEKPRRWDVLANHDVHEKRSDPFWSERLGIDSAGLYEDACKAHEAYVRARAEGHPLAEVLRSVPRIDSEAYRRWRAVRGEYEIVTEAVWIDDYIIRYGCDWARQTTGVVWVPFRTVGAAFEEAGLKYFGGGAQGAEITEWDGGSCAASFKSHHASKNLQYQWSRALYLVPPANGQLFEQSLARFDRIGQEAESCEFDVLQLCSESEAAVAQALADARYAHESWDSQRLMSADISSLKITTRPKWLFHD